MRDEFGSQSTGITGPARKAAEVTPSDTPDPANRVSRAIYVGGSGDLSVVMKSGSQVLLRNVAAGSMLPLCVTQVRASGTTATDLVAFW